MKLKGWLWKVKPEGQIVATKDIRLAKGQAVALEITSPKNFESEPLAMVVFMQRRIEAMTELDVRRDLQQGGVPKEWLKGFKL